MQVRQAEAQQQLAQEQVENAVQAGYVNLLTAFTDLRTQEKSVTLANEHYAVTDNRYRNGMALLTDMLDAGNMKRPPTSGWSMPASASCTNIIRCNTSSTRWDCRIRGVDFRFQISDFRFQIPDSRLVPATILQTI